MASGEEQAEPAMSSEEAQEGYTSSERLFSIILSAFVALIFLTIGLSGNPRLVSSIIWITLAIYIILLSVEGYAEFAWLAVVAMVSAHIGALVSYYSNPLVLPFVIIERGRGHESLNIDIVQIVLLVEIIRQYLRYRKKLKSPAPKVEVMASGEDLPR